MLDNTITEMKNAFDGFIKRLNIPEERIIVPKEFPAETSKKKNKDKN